MMPGRIRKLRIKRKAIVSCNLLNLSPEAIKWKYLNSILRKKLLIQKKGHYLTNVRGLD